MGSRLFAIIVKEMWALLRDPRSRITLIVPPLAQLFLFGFATTLEIKNFDVGIYNRDGSIWSQEFVQRLQGSPNVHRILALRSPSEVRTAIDGGSVLAVVMFDQTFSRDIAAGRPAVIQAVLDGRRSNAAQIVAGYLTQMAAEMGADINERQGIDVTDTDDAMPANSQSVVTNWYNPNLDYLWFAMPGLMVLISVVSGLSTTAQAVARERELGTFDQLMISPLRVHEILIGKMVPPLLFGLFNATMYLVVIAFLFRVPVTGSLSFFYLATVFYLLALIGVGMLVSAMSQTQQQAFLGSFLVTVPAILLSGYASPIDNMPHWLQVLAKANPCKHFFIISEGFFLKSMSADDILTNTWPLVLIAAVTLSASALLFRARME